MEHKIRTWIRVDPQAWKRFRIQALELNMSTERLLGQLVEAETLETIVKKEKA